jgi:hypothetical protein
VAAGRGKILGKIEKTTTEFSLLAIPNKAQFRIAGNAVKISELLVKRLFISYS